MERTEWPTKQYLSGLREEGKFYYSAPLTRMALGIAALLVALSIGREWSGLTGEYRELFAQGLRADSDAGEPVWHKFLPDIAEGFLGLAVVAVLVALSCILLQSRFLIRFKFMTLDFARLNPLLRERTPGGFLPRLLAFHGYWLLSLVGGACLCYLGAQGVLSLLNKTMAYFISWPRLVVTEYAAIWLILLLIFAGGCWLLGWYRFLSAHKMTRAELRAELQE